MRVCFVLPSLFHLQRGIERSCVFLSNEMSRRGNDVTIISCGKRDEKPPSFLSENVRVIKIPYSRYFQVLLVIPFYFFHLLVHTYDVVNIYFAGFGEAEAISLAKLFRGFKVTFIVGYPLELVPHRFREFKRYGFHKRLGRIIVKSPDMAPAISAFFERKVDTIPNGVDADYFNPETVSTEPLKEQFNLSGKDKIMLTVAALEKRKGIQYGIQMIPTLLEAGFSVHYFILGSGTYLKELEAIAANLKVSDRVHFIEAKEDVRPYYKLADIILLLSYGEGFPNALLEAWAMCLPAIVSKQPPYPSIVPEHLRFLVDEKQPHELKAVLIELLASPELCRQKGLAARQYVIDHYLWGKVAKQHLDYYW